MNKNQIQKLIIDVSVVVVNLTNFSWIFGFIWVNFWKMKSIFGTIVYDLQ